MFGFPPTTMACETTAARAEQPHLRALPARPREAEVRADRIVVAAGEESAQQLTGRAAVGVAEALGTELSSSPATTPASSVASSGSTGSRSGSPLGSTRCWRPSETPTAL